MSDDKIKELNALLDRVVSYGPGEAVGWLRGAYLTHEDQLERLRDKLGEVRSLFLKEVNRPLTVREAQLCNVCRVCRSDAGASPGNPVVLNYGEEHAHEQCLTGPDRYAPPSRDELERELEQYRRVVQEGLRLPAPDLKQDAAFAAFVLGRLESRVGELEQALRDVLTVGGSSASDQLIVFSDLDGTDPRAPAARERIETRKRARELLDGSRE